MTKKMNGPLSPMYLTDCETLTSIMINQMTVPLYEMDDDGSIKPNLLFHRAWDKLHSRCIEYPFAAAQLDIETASISPESSQATDAV